MAKQSNEYRQKFRTDMDPALEKEINDALGGMSVEDLMGEGKAPAVVSASEGAAAAPPRQAGMRHGKIISINKDDVFVDFGGKSQGVVSMAQFEVEPKVGQEMDFVVDRYDPAEGLLILSLKGATATNVSWETLEVGQIVEGTVTGVNKGGLELEVKSMRAFMPAGQVELFHVPDFAQYVGQRVTAEVMQFDREGRNIVLSRRNVLEREREEAKTKLMEEIQEGQTRRGTVRSVMDFGAFVDLGGVDGLIHVSELALRRVKKASDVIKVGDVVDVKIVKIDRETGKLGLSLKQAMPDPWVDAAAKYPVGTTLTGRVMRVEAFGAFVEAEEGVEGLLPVSEMSWQRIKHPSDLVKEGDTVKLVVLSLDPVARRMSFSMKQAGPDPWKTVSQRYATDMIVSGTVTRTAEFGAFVELEPGLEGLVHISELADQRVRAASDVAKVGQQVQVQVLDVDPEARRMSLSIKRAKAAGAQAAAEASAATAAAQPQKPKKKIELRGGLDFEYRKNK
jgi:small subunit ribosomal protein S1